MPTETITGDSNKNHPMFTDSVQHLLILPPLSQHSIKPTAMVQDSSDSSATWGVSPTAMPCWHGAAGGSASGLCHWSYLPALNAGTPSLCSVKRQLWFWSSAIITSIKLSSEKKEIQIIRLFYKSLNLLFSSDSYGLYTTNCILVSCWFFLPSSLPLKKILQCQKPSLSSPGRVLSLILVR